jgi:hypothetical protein
MHASRTNSYRDKEKRYQQPVGPSMNKSNELAASCLRLSQAGEKRQGKFAEKFAVARNGL